MATLKPRWSCPGSRLDQRAASGLVPGRRATRRLTVRFRNVLGSGRPAQGGANRAAASSGSARRLTNFLGDRALTTASLRGELSDVPPTSLYRHVARLVDAGVLTVVAERRVRGTVERTYVLRLSAASIGLDEVAAMTAEDHRQAFMAYVAWLLGDFDRYLARGDVDLLRDQVSYRLAAMWLDHAEFAQLRRELARVLQPRLANPPAAGRTRRILASIMLPGDEVTRDQCSPADSGAAPARFDSKRSPTAKSQPAFRPQPPCTAHDPGDIPVTR